MLLTRWFISEIDPRIAISCWICKNWSMRDEERIFEIAFISIFEFGWSWGGFENFQCKVKPCSKRNEIIYGSVINIVVIFSKKKHIMWWTWSWRASLFHCQSRSQWYFWWRRRQQKFIAWHQNRAVYYYYWWSIIFPAALNVS